MSRIPKVCGALVALAISQVSGAEEAFTPLPFGSIKPGGWLRTQMQQDLDQGFVGKLDKLVPELIKEDDIYGKNRLTKLVKRKELGTHNSGAEWEVQFLWWNSETQSNWWDGFLRNALLLGDVKHIDRVRKYVNDKLATADEDGYIGIYEQDLRYKHTTENGELWAQASLFRGLLAYYEATGDKAVLEAVTRAVHVTMDHYPANRSTPFKTEGAFAGVGHGLTFVDVLNTLYRLTKRDAYLDYALFLYNDYSRHPQPEEDIQLDNLLDKTYRFKGHGVHTFEHLRALTMAAFHSGESKYTQALEAYLIRLEQVTTASGGPIGDEWIAGRHAHHSHTGYEYCSLQELLHSYAVLLHKTGNPVWADKIEWLIFNAAQGARHPSGRSVAYCHSDNATNVLGHLDMNNPQGEMRFKYSPAHQDVAVCCVPNAGRIYPYYVQNQWQRTAKGVVANLFGPSSVVVQIDGVDVKIEQKTHYPFAHEIEFVVFAARPVSFELKLRRPGWADDVEAIGVEIDENGQYLAVDKSWQGTQKFRIRFTDTPRVAEHSDGTAGVSHGPLLYALPIPFEEIKGRQYPIDGFHDLFLKSKHKTYRDYQIAFEHTFTLDMPDGTPGWFNPPVLRGELYRPDKRINEHVELTPMGTTSLRITSFVIAGKQGKKQ